MKFDVTRLCVAFLLITFSALPSLAQVPGQITEILASKIQVRNGTMVVDVTHNGAFGLPEGPGLVHGWVNGFSTVCEPNSNQFTVQLPAWRVTMKGDASAPVLFVTAYQDKTNVTIRKSYTAAQVQALIDREP